MNRVKAYCTPFMSICYKKNRCEEGVLFVRHRSYIEHICCFRLLHSGVRIDPWDVPNFHNALYNVDFSRTSLLGLRTFFDKNTKRMPIKDGNSNSM